MARTCARNTALKHAVFILNAVLAAFGLAILINAAALIGLLGDGHRGLPAYGIGYGLFVLLLSILGIIAAALKSFHLTCIYAVFCLAVALIQLVYLLSFDKLSLKSVLADLGKTDTHGFDLVTDKVCWRYPLHNSQITNCLLSKSEEDCDADRFKELWNDAKCIVDTVTSILSILTLLKVIIFSIALNFAYVLHENRKHEFETLRIVQQKSGHAIYMRA